MHANGRQLCGVVDAGDLCTQVVLLSAEIEGVGDDLTLEIASEADLDLAGSSKVFRIQIGKRSPGALCLVCNIVGVLIDTLTTSFAALGPRIFWEVLRL